MNYGEIKKTDIANGPGVRVSLFVSGCTHHCKGCFNPETWSFSYGKPFTGETAEEILLALKPAYISGLTLLGGEPLEDNNQIQLLELVKQVKEVYPQKTIWCYTGYTFETDVLQGMCEQQSVTRKLLSYVDVLVDGEFIEEQKNIRLQFRGSENQRMIDVQASLAEKTTVLWNG